MTAETGEVTAETGGMAGERGVMAENEGTWDEGVGLCILFIAPSVNWRTQLIALKRHQRVARDAQRFDLLRAAQVWQINNEGSAEDLAFKHPD